MTILHVASMQGHFCQRLSALDRTANDFCLGDSSRHKSQCKIILVAPCKLRPVCLDIPGSVFQLPAAPGTLNAACGGAAC
jgi:hypothetical protein